MVPYISFIYHNMYTAITGIADLISWAPEKSLRPWSKWVVGDPIQKHKDDFINIAYINTFACNMYVFVSEMTRVLWNNADVVKILSVTKYTTGSVSSVKIAL